MAVRRLDGIARLREQQAELVAALVAGGELPPAFAADPRTAAGVAAASSALAHKRAGEVARAWPLLAASIGPEWTHSFTAWAAGRAPAGSLADGFAFARSLRAAGTLPDQARPELAAAEARFTLDGGQAVPRRFPALRRVPGGVVVQVRGRVMRLVS